MTTWADRLQVLRECTSAQRDEVIKPTKEVKQEDDSELLQLSPGCFQVIASFLSYGDLQEMCRVSKKIENILAADNVLWEDQLISFHSEMRNLYGDHLLRSDFACIPESDVFSQFMAERGLYDFDSNRTWNLHEYTQIRDETTGVFTIPLYREPTCGKGERGKEKLPMIGAPPFAESISNEDLSVRILHPERRSSAAAPPVDMNDEEAMLQYALTLSMKTSSASQRHNPFTDAHVNVAQPFYTPTQLLTMVDEVRRVVTSDRYGLYDKTDEECDTFLSVLSTTLSGAKRRRLLLKNHHHALRNNGQTSRRRMGSQQAHQDPNSTPIPTENRILAAFTGTLIEISAAETIQLCQKMLDKKWLAAVQTFVSGANENGRETTDPPLPRPYPKEWVRYFLIPEVCVERRLGIVIIDPIRAFLLVQEEMRIVDSDAEPDDIVAQHPVVYGRGYNANA